MADSAEAFLARVKEHLGSLSGDGFAYESWNFDKRPTNEGVGMVPNVSVDVQKLVDTVLDVERYPADVKYVDSVEVLNKTSDTDFTYVQHVSLPVLGKIQMALHIADYGDQDGFRVVAWSQDDEATMALNKKDGYRTEYNLGAWLIKEDVVYYALSSCPLKSDVGRLKFAVMAKGSDATGSTVVKDNINGMIALSQR